LNGLVSENQQQHSNEEQEQRRHSRVFLLKVPWVSCSANPEVCPLWGNGNGQTKHNKLNSSGPVVSCGKLSKSL